MRQMKLKYLKSNNGEDYCSSGLRLSVLLMRSKGLKMVSMKPRQNKVAQRMNGMILEHARSMILNVGLPKKLWVEAVNIAAYLINTGPSISLDCGLPEEAWTGKEEKLYGKTITVADRRMVEENADEILTEASKYDVAFLIVGDPFRATTHSYFVVRAKKFSVEVKAIHNASIMNAIGVCGLQLYRYGETVSLPFFKETWRQDNFYEKIQRNKKLGLHTLCLLDIRVKEPSLEKLCSGRKSVEPPIFMTITTAIEQLLEVEEARGLSAYGENSRCVGFARLGGEDQMVVAGSMKDLLHVDFGKPLHCLIIVGETHPLEEEMLEFYTVK